MNGHIHINNEFEVLIVLKSKRICQLTVNEGNWQDVVITESEPLSELVI